MDHVVVIPARFGSGRFPGKPLTSIAGVPMIERTYRRCALGYPADRIWVATDDERILDHCRTAGMQAAMTSQTCLTGTDRVAEFAQQVDAEYYINVQGDEPLFNPDDISGFIRNIERYPGTVLNGFCPIEDEAMFYDPSMPKVVFDGSYRLLYMSRAAIPTSKALRFLSAWRQVCIYAFPRDALLAFAAHGRKTPLEEIEDIEILRFVELGYQVQMVETSNQSVPVDHPDDVEKVERILRALEPESSV
jgi:3-deoxy-manno-octulosonate cytidylyltransferase (CMP-KDO synthetase)